MKNENQLPLREWANGVKAKVGLKCVKCGTNKGLNAHHIYDKKTYPDKMYDLNNGTVLCDTCHAKFHSLYGRGENTRAQLTEFLNAEDYDKGTVHIRIYTKPLQEGILRELGGDLWITYCALAMYMDKDYKCYPSQSLLASKLGVSRATINRRIGLLCNMKWQGEPLVAKVENKNKGAFSNNVYYINPLVFEIY